MECHHPDWMVTATMLVGLVIWGSLFLWISNKIDAAGWRKYPDWIQQNNARLLYGAARTIPALVFCLFGWGYTLEWMPLPCE